MKFKENRLVFQQAPQNPETQPQPQPQTETGKEVALPGPELNKEALPSSPDAVSTEYKEKGKQHTASAANKLTPFEDLIKNAQA